MSEKSEKSEFVALEAEWGPARLVWGAFWLSEEAMSTEGLYFIYLCK